MPINEHDVPNLKLTGIINSEKMAASALMVRYLMEGWLQAHGGRQGCFLFNDCRAKAEKKIHDIH
jgi:hypothetical protein